ncbi:TPA: hypothetical protein ACRMWJ_005533 [Pseudomonas aeruginosa]
MCKTDGLRCVSIVLTLLGIAVPITITAAYFWAFSNSGAGLSSRPEDWSAFGAVLAGAFTFLSAISTTLALVFVSAQTGLARATAARQIESLTLGQYISHRSVFSERLETLERHFKGGISFLALDELYGRVFSKNSPVHFEARVNISNTESGQLAHLVNLYEALHDSVMGIQRGEIGLVYKFVQRFLRFQDSLGIIVKDAEGIGQVQHRKYDKALNVFSLMDSLKRAEYVLNSYLFYSANKTVGRFRKLNVDELPFWVMYGLAHARGVVITVHLGSNESSTRFKQFLSLYKMCIEGGRETSVGTVGVREVYTYREALAYLKYMLSNRSRVNSEVLDDWDGFRRNLKEKLKPGLERDMERNGEYGALYRRAEFEKILGKLKL